MRALCAGISAAFAAPRRLDTQQWHTLLGHVPQQPARTRTFTPLMHRGVVRSAERTLALLAWLSPSRWRTTCLYRSIAVCAALRALGVPAVLRLGATRVDAGIAAHAWVTDDVGCILYGDGQRYSGFSPPNLQKSLRVAPQTVRT